MAQGVGEKHGPHFARFYPLRWRNTIETMLYARRCCARATARYALDDPSLYFSRELSWLEFNDRVLEEALDARNPLLRAA